MSWLTEYLLSITAAAIICVAVKHIVAQKSTVGNMVSVVSGIFMLITVLSPLLNRSVGDFSDFLKDFNISGDDVAVVAVGDSNAELKQIIKQQSEEYILEETKHMSLEVQVYVEMADTNPPVPDCVTITGNASPYKKEALSTYITNNFGISREKIQWN